MAVQSVAPLVAGWQRRNVRRQDRVGDAMSRKIHVLPRNSCNKRLTRQVELMNSVGCTRWRRCRSTSSRRLQRAVVIRRFKRTACGRGGDGRLKMSRTTKRGKIRRPSPAGNEVRHTKSVRGMPVRTRFTRQSPFMGISRRHVGKVLRQRNHCYSSSSGASRFMRETVIPNILSYAAARQLAQVCCRTRGGGEPVGTASAGSGGM